MKPSSLGPPEVYLGGKVSQFILPSGVEACSYSVLQYLHETIRSLEDYLEKGGRKLSEEKVDTPLPANWHPKLDISPELMYDEAAYYTSLIGNLQWIVKLGRIEITVKYLRCRLTFVYNENDTWMGCCICLLISSTSTTGHLFLIKQYSFSIHLYPFIYLSIH